MWAGLVRLGWNLPPLIPTLSRTHGPLMISGFLGTLINLERVIALNRKWMYAAPSSMSTVRDPTDLPAPIGRRAPQTVQVSLETVKVNRRREDAPRWPANPVESTSSRSA
jgi:hypothetical protein